MNKIPNDEVQYCNHCGSANVKSASVCVECKKEIHTKYKPFYDFLKKHTKEELSGTVSDNFFSYIKNFLLSHIYGVALSVTVVTTSVSAVASYQPHIKKVDEVKTVSTVKTVAQNEVQEEETVSQPLTDDDFYSFNSLMCNYDSYVDEMRPSDTYWGVADYYNNVGEMYAENNIPSFNYGGFHEMISNPIAFYSVDTDPAFAYSEDNFQCFLGDRHSDNSSAKSGSDCTTEIAKRLFNDGYNVAECNYVMTEQAGPSREDLQVTKKLVYKFVFVEYEGKWHIVEDRLIERVNA